MIPAQVLEEQVGDLPAKVHVPADWRSRQPDGESDWTQSTQRARELQQSLERLDFRWDMEFIEKDEYMAKRAALQEQIARNQPLAEQEFVQAEKRWRGFRETWPGGDVGQRKDLLLAMLERVSLNGRVVEAITLRPAFLHLARQAKHLMSETDAQILGPGTNDGRDR